MHAGISDCAAREATNTLYLDKRVFPAALQLPSEDTICALLVDRAGHVLWRAEGVITEEKEQALQRTLDE
jgi:predicted transcriptional regulator